MSCRIVCPPVVAGEEEEVLLRVLGSILQTGTFASGDVTALAVVAVQGMEAGTRGLAQQALRWLGQTVPQWH